MALKGITVLEFAGLAPAPFCGMILNEFGATVIRIDRSGSYQPFVEDVLAHGKKSLAIDLKHEKGTAIIRNLANKSDVILEPFRKGVMEKLRLGPDILSKSNPRLIYARLSGYGQSGPFSNMAGHDINYLGLSGILSLLGWRNKNPTPPSNIAADFGGGGLMCALGIVLALFERSRSGLGQVIDCNMVEGSAYLGSWLTRSYGSVLWDKPRGENHLDGGAHYYDTYETRDGQFMAVGALEPQFYARLLQGVGLSEDELPQMDNERGRETLTRKFKEKTQEEWCQIFDGTDACVTPVLSLPQAASHPHNHHRGTFVPNNEGLIAPAPAPRLSRTPGVSKVDQPNTRNGQHTRQVLRQFGYTNTDIEKLIDENVIDCTDKDNSKL